MEELLRAAASSLAGGDDEGALAALLDAWRACRAPEIADVIDVLSDRITARLEAVPRRKQWHRVARDLRAADVGRLLAGLHMSTWMGVHEIDELYRRPEDPRISMAFAQMLPRALHWPELRNILARGIRRALDVRTLGLLAKLEVGDGRALQELRRAMEGIEAEAPAPLPPAAVAVVERLRAPIDALRGTEADLLAAIYAAPDDDQRRLVYGDWLLDRGRPRGELIALQSLARERALSPEEQRRERELLRGHMVEWLGPLAPVVSRPFRFERGFLASATLRHPEAALTKVGAPEWSTVSELHCWSGDARLADFLRAPVMRSLRALHGPSGALARALAAGPPTALETATLSLDEPEPAFHGTRAFPHLRDLRMRGPIAAFAWALGPHVARGLRRLVLLHEETYLPSWLAALHATPPPRLESFVFEPVGHGEVSVVFAREPSGWRISAPGLPGDVLARLLQRAPSGMITGSG